MATTIPYHIFPGIQGTMARPFPSDFPLPMDIMESVCNVFETHGRSCEAYRSQSVQATPRITVELLLYGRVRNSMSYDIFKMVSYIIHEHCRWKPSEKAFPERYSRTFIAEFLQRPDTNVRNWRRLAKQLIRHDACFRRMYLLCIEEVERSHRLVFDRPRLDSPRASAA